MPNPDPPIKHEPVTAGYGDPRDGDSWCDACGWKTTDDYFGIEGLAHAAKNNAAYYTWLEDLIGDVKDVLTGFYGLVVDDRTPEGRLARIALILDVPKKECGWVWEKT